MMSLLKWIQTIKIVFSLADLISQMIALVDEKHGNEDSKDFKIGEDRKTIVVNAASEFIDGLLLNLNVAPELIAYLKKQGISDIVELLYQIWRWTGGKP